MWWINTLLLPVMVLTLTFPLVTCNLGQPGLPEPASGAETMEKLHGEEFQSCNFSSCSLLHGWSVCDQWPLLFFCSFPTCSSQSCGNYICIVPWSCDVCYCSVYEILMYFGSLRINTSLLPSFFFIDIRWGQDSLLVKCQFISSKEITCADRCWFLSISPYVDRHTSSAKPRDTFFLQCPKERLIILIQIVVLTIPKNLSLANMAQFETSSLHSGSINPSTRLSPSFAGSACHPLCLLCSDCKRCKGTGSVLIPFPEDTGRLL